MQTLYDISEILNFSNIDTNIWIFHRKYISFFTYISNKFPIPKNFRTKIYYSEPKPFRTTSQRIMYSWPWRPDGVIMVYVCVRHLGSEKISRHQCDTPRLLVCRARELPSVFLSPLHPSSIRVPNYCSSESINGTGKRQSPRPIFNTECRGAKERPANGAKKLLELTVPSGNKYWYVCTYIHVVRRIGC